MNSYMFTQDEVATLIGRSQGLVSQLRRGGVPSGETVYYINLGIDYLSILLESTAERGIDCDALREQLKLGTSKVAFIFNVSASKIRKWERGGKPEGNDRRMVRRAIEEMKYLFAAMTL